MVSIFTYLPLDVLHSHVPGMSRPTGISHANVPALIDLTLKSLNNK